MERRWGASIVLQRHIEADTQHSTLYAGFADVQLYGSRKRVDLASLPNMAAVAALILAVDAEHMLRRTAELPNSPVVQISIEDAGLSDDLQFYFAKPVGNYLKNRFIRVEPTDWAERRALV